MISFETAETIVLSQTRLLEKISVPLEKSHGCFLAEVFCAPFPLPRFDNTAVDGYAIRRTDFLSATDENPIAIQVVATLAAGEVSTSPLPKQGGYIIFTGAKIPDEVDAVVMREEVETAQGLIVTKPPKLHANIRKVGEEIPVGSIVLKSHHYLNAASIGLLASFGCAQVTVYRKPKISLLITGDELLSLSDPLQDGMIFDSNSHSLVATLRECGIDDITVRLVRDDLSIVQQELDSALRQADIVITVGGISVGDFDFLKSGFEAAGVTEQFWRVAIKPGKPTFFGTKHETTTTKLVFGLPGNPVAALVTFRNFVLPAIRKMSGAAQCTDQLFAARVTTDLRKKTDRLDFVRARWSFEGHELVVTPLRGQDSHMLSGLSNANCFIRFPSDLNFIPAGDLVTVQRIDGGLTQ